MTSLSSDAADVELAYILERGTTSNIFSLQTTLSLQKPIVKFISIWLMTFLLMTWKNYQSWTNKGIITVQVSYEKLAAFFAIQTFKSTAHHLEAPGKKEKIDIF